MNEILTAIKERRSIRKYKPDMVSKELIDQVIEAGLYAASGKNGQPAIIVAVTNKEVRDKLSVLNGQVADMPEGHDPFYGAPVVLIVLSRKDWPTYLYDGSLVIGNLILAAHSLGLGSCWIHRAKQEFETEEYKQLLVDLGIEGEYEGIGHCILGYPDVELPRAPARKEGRVYYID